MPKLPEIEYRVRPVTRFIVTRYHKDGGTGSSEQKGTFDDPEVAYDAAYSMCKVEHESHGWPLDDMRIQYPRRLVERDVLIDDKPMIVWTPEGREPFREFNAPPKSEKMTEGELILRAINAAGLTEDQKRTIVRKIQEIGKDA